jgi:hypothetical protein
VFSHLSFSDWHTSKGKHGKNGKKWEKMGNMEEESHKRLSNAIAELRKLVNGKLAFQERGYKCNLKLKGGSLAIGNK